MNNIIVKDDLETLSDDILYIHYNSFLKNNSKVKVSESIKNGGKGLFCINNKINVGEIIFEERPIINYHIHNNNNNEYDKYCSFCFKNLYYDFDSVNDEMNKNFKDYWKMPNNIIKCGGKCKSVFCNNICQAAGKQRFHGYICNNNNNNNINELFEYCQINNSHGYMGIFLIMAEEINLKKNMLPFLVSDNNSKHVISQTLNIINTKPFNLIKSCLLNIFKNKEEKEEEIVNNICTPENYQKILGKICLNSTFVSPDSPFTITARNISNDNSINTKSKNINNLTNYLQKLKNQNYQFVKSDCICIYRIQSCINHSCDPNSELRFSCIIIYYIKDYIYLFYIYKKYIYIDGDHRLVVVALKDIKVNEEITVSYIDCNLDLEDRKRELSIGYLFTCECGKCVGK